ncbi:MAG: UDP-N-acetylglucosamine enolpyruvyl transferase [candidate division TM6 bacterium GW2011_GWE2_42_60]|nr:MAG: UDP-N-acetylglucosamine enolpyruvyl transferase [candidate division TM6 bacterium GW2011_GWE2_42_60]
MSRDCLLIRNAGPLSGEVTLEGAKNAVLVSIASLILADGLSRLTKVPASHDVYQMVKALGELGIAASFDERTHELVVDATTVSGVTVSPEIMKSMRASILLMGPLLARCGSARIALPGGCSIGTRPVDLHLRAFVKMGAVLIQDGDFLEARVNGQLKGCRIVLDYPSVGATENIIMAALGAHGITEIVNAALEPEVLDFIELLKSMGAQIDFTFPATIVVQGDARLRATTYCIMRDRLEAGTLLMAAAATGGSISIPDAPVSALELVLVKLEDMGHLITVGSQGRGVTLVATREMKPISFKTMPYPGFPTDLQAPMTVLMALARGTSSVHETVFENRLMHVPELQKMGANIVVSGDRATITGVKELCGAPVVATDIRSAAALIIAGLVAQGETSMTGTHHLFRGYEGLDEKLRSLGACIDFVN